mmetsp:Transcript_11087/g.31118  ORF Transcript_11087/g.31118 Transcript_11087/m.31118 type:complete len:389 (-) Transcript_11087:300-1466(-)
MLLTKMRNRLLKCSVFVVIVFRSHLFSGRVPTKEDIKKILVPAVLAFSSSVYLPPIFHKYLLAALQVAFTPLPPWLFWFDLLDAFSRSKLGRRIGRPIWSLPPIPTILVPVLMQLFHEAPEFIDSTYRTLLHSMLGVGYHAPLGESARLVCRQCPRLAGTVHEKDGACCQTQSRGEKGVDVVRRIPGRPRPLSDNENAAEAVRRAWNRVRPALLNAGRFYAGLFLVVRPLASRRLPCRDDLTTATGATAAAIGSALACDLGGYARLDNAPQSLNLILRVFAALPGHFASLLCPTPFRTEYLNVMSSQGAGGLAAWLFSRATGLDASPPSLDDDLGAAHKQNPGPAGSADCTVASRTTSTYRFRQLVACLHPILLPGGKVCGKMLSLFV